LTIESVAEGSGLPNSGRFQSRVLQRAAGRSVTTAASPKGNDNLSVLWFLRGSSDRKAQTSGGESLPQGGVVSAAEEPWRGSNPTRGRPVRARAVGRETLEKEGQESCRRTGRVKPTGERGASEWEEGFKAGPSP
jgi:hypothetical protein